ncbi:MAG: hypothetical protein CSYNP_03940 [Syntrophus sp. SKADARSKE-3]|nr:hypothetical protein [Syntrophus sp. SKADARSKE-3]
MAGDLLDYWVRLIKTIFPANAWIDSRFYNNNYLIQIDWRLENDPEHPNKRSKRIEILIKEGFIEDYLNENTKGRESTDAMLASCICERFNHFKAYDDTYSVQHAAPERWLIPRHAFRDKLSLNAAPGI